MKRSLSANKLLRSSIAPVRRPGMLFSILRRLPSPLLVMSSLKEALVEQTFREGASRNYTARFVNNSSPSVMRSPLSLGTGQIRPLVESGRRTLS